MYLKNNLKRVIGEKNLMRIRQIKSYVKYTMNRKKHGFLKIENDSWCLSCYIYKKKTHCFFGYYDLQQLNSHHDKMLFHCLDCNAQNGKDKISICLYDIESGETTILDESKAWSWQQGCRLRWHPQTNNLIIFNDCIDNEYVTIIYDIDLRKRVKVLPIAMYDINSKFKYGLSINFSRLQRLRPGYGYCILPDKTKYEFAPSNDGLLLYDFQTEKKKLLISLDELANKSNTKNQWNYLNHISFSPNGSKFMFFHIVTGPPLSRWKVWLYIANSDGSNLHCIENDMSASHYCWRNNDELLITTCGFGGSKSNYVLYNVNTGEKHIIESTYLHNDGHPNFFPDKDRLISDTYPQENSIQRIFSIKKDGSGYSPICAVYHDERMFEEKRCDTHPRLFNDGSYFSIDTTYKGGVRSCLLFSKK